MNNDSRLARRMPMTGRARVLAFICFLALLVSTNAKAGFFGPDNAAECIFVKIDGVSNEHEARRVEQDCRNEFPGESKPGIFGTGSYGECIDMHMSKALSPGAAKIIERTCRSMYSM